MRLLDHLIRSAGVVVSLVAALATGVLELALAPLRVAGVLIGVAALVTVAANAAIAWFAVATVGRRWAVVPPWALWTVLMFIAAGVRTDEGDQLLAGDNWVGLVMILLGSLVFALYAYRLILFGSLPAVPGPRASTQRTPPVVSGPPPGAAESAAGEKTETLF